MSSYLNVSLHYLVNYITPFWLNGQWLVPVSVICGIWLLILWCDQLSICVNIHFADLFSVDLSIKWIFDWSFTCWSPITSSSDSPLCSFITHLSITPSLKLTCFTNPLPCSFTSSSRTAFTDFCLHCFFWANRFLVFPYFFISLPCTRLSWPYRQLLSARKYIVSVWAGHLVQLFGQLRLFFISECLFDQLIHCSFAPDCWRCDVS